MNQTMRARHRRLRRVAGRRPHHGRLIGGALFIVALAGGGVAVAAALAFSVYAGLADDLPADPSVAFSQQILGPAKIYDRNGTLLYEFEDETEGLRNPVDLKDISPWVIKATIATEDNSFYDNPGVNVRGLARAGVENFIETDVGVLQGTGGSSITQQLAKNVFIPEQERYQRSPERKLKEAVYALELTRRYPKDKILEWYLNQIHYGNRSNGIGAAARRYFGKPARDLTLAESAMLAGLPQSPSRYDPYQNREAANGRQHQVLDLMVRHGDITEDQAAAAKVEGEKLQFATPDVRLLAPHWVFYVRDVLINKFGLDTFRNGGLRVVTTLDLNLQNKAEQIVEDKIAYYESPKGGNCECHNASVVAIDNNTGQILAMVGSRNYWNIDIEGENNNAIAIKQPGSAFKPVVYLAAFMKGWNPGTTIYDQPTKFISRIDGARREYFTPEGPIRWQGGMSARDSLGNSMNTAAVKAAGYVGPDGVIDMAHKVGITTLDDRENYGVSIATGGANLTLLDLTYAYSTIANNGEMRGMEAVKPVPGHRTIDPVPLLSVTDGNGNELYRFAEPKREQVVPAGYAYEVTDILKDNAAKRRTYGNPEAQFGFPDKRQVAAKTGTQQGPTDIKTVLATWNFGYVPDLTVGVWVGNANNALVNRNLTSASSSLLIWKEVMAASFEILKIPPKEFQVPPDIEWRSVNGRREPVVKGTKIVDREDLRLWAAAGNPTSPIRTTDGDSDNRPQPTATATPEGQPGQLPAATVTPSARPRVPGLPPPPGEQPQPTQAPAPPRGSQPPQPQPQPPPQAEPTQQPPATEPCRPGPPFYSLCPR